MLQQNQYWVYVLGHQAIGEAFGGRLINLTTVYHGVATPIKVLKNAINKSRT